MKLIWRECGIGTIEYLLVIAAAVALVAALFSFTSIGPQLVELVCPAVDTAPTSSSCVGS